jgi:hypothetical protein
VPFFHVSSLPSISAFDRYGDGGSCSGTRPDSKVLPTAADLRKIARIDRPFGRRLGSSGSAREIGTKT